LGRKGCTDAAPVSIPPPSSPLLPLTQPPSRLPPLPLISPFPSTPSLTLPTPSQDTITGFLLAGVGNVDLRKRSNFLLVDGKTSAKDIEASFREFTSRDDIAILLLSQACANSIRPLVDKYKKVREAAGRVKLLTSGGLSRDLQTVPSPPPYRSPQTLFLPPSTLHPLQLITPSLFLTLPRSLFLLSVTPSLPPPSAAPPRHPRDPLQGHPLRPLQRLHPRARQDHILRRQVKNTAATKYQQWRLDGVLGGWGTGLFCLEGVEPPRGARAG
jgi:vacuolar-type H+-ATPase subunit F/Vma7